MPDRSTRRLLVLRVLVLSMLLTLLGRLAHLQVWSGDDYVQAAAQNRLREVVATAARGGSEGRGRGLSLTFVAMEEESRCAWGWRVMKLSAAAALSCVASFRRGFPGRSKGC